MKYLQHVITVTLLSLAGSGAFAADCCLDNLMEGCYCATRSHEYFFVEGDLLYWQPYIDGMEYNFGTTSLTSSSTDGHRFVVTHELDVDPTFRWDLGYRVGAGINCMDTAADLAAFWTCFHGHAHQKSNAPDFGHWKVQFDQIDVVARYEFDYCSLAIQPFLGLRAAQINQKLYSHLEIFYEDLTTPAASYVKTIVLDDHQKFKGIGPVFGFNLGYYLGYGFGLCGTLGGSCMFGKLDASFHDTESSSAPVNIDILSLQHSRINNVNAAFDLTFGVEWKKMFCDCRSLGIRIMGEHHQYFNQNNIGAYGDLSFNGVTFLINIDL